MKKLIEVLVLTVKCVTSKEELKRFEEEMGA